MERRSNSWKCLVVTAMFSLAAVAAAVCFPARASAQQNPQSASTSPAESAKPNLAGTWNLNKDQSDDPRQKMQEAMGGSGGGGGAWQGGGGRGRQGGPDGAGGRGGMMAEFNQLTITQSGPSVKIAGSSGRLLAQTSDSASSNQPQSAQSAPEGGPQFSPPAAQWQGNQLISVMEGRRGGKTTRTYQLSSDGKQLIVTTKIENERLGAPVTFRQVYDPAATGGQQSSQ